MTSEITLTKMRRFGYWWSDKKMKKFNLAEFHKSCKMYNLEPIKLDLELPLEEQGPFSAIIHKISDVLVKADQGDLLAKIISQEFEAYVHKHPKIVVIDPIHNVRKLLDRFVQYKLIQESDLDKNEVFTPPFVEIMSKNNEENLRKLKESNVSFPIVCKPILAHGSSLAHQMTLIFGPQGLKDVNPPSVAQAFINHGAILYKVFVIGDSYTIIERPSLKNFKENNNSESIFFDSHDISKPNSDCSLNKLDEEDAMTVSIAPYRPQLDRIVKTLHNFLGLDLLGVDIIVDNNSKRLAIIDINLFPGYDGMDNLWDCICQLISERISNPSLRQPCDPPCLESSRKQKDQKNKTTDSNPEDSGIDTSDSCDEKKNLGSSAMGKMVRRQHSRCPGSNLPNCDLQLLEQA